MDQQSANSNMFGGERKLSKDSLEKENCENFIPKRSSLLRKANGQDVLISEVAKMKGERFLSKSLSSEVFPKNVSIQLELDPLDREKKLNSRRSSLLQKANGQDVYISETARTKGGQFMAKNVTDITNEFGLEYLKATSCNPPKSPETVVLQTAVNTDIFISEMAQTKGDQPVIKSCSFKEDQIVEFCDENHGDFSRKSKSRKSSLLQKANGQDVYISEIATTKGEAFISENVPATVEDGDVQKSSFLQKVIVGVTTKPKEEQFMVMGQGILTECSKPFELDNHNNFGAIGINKERRKSTMLQKANGGNVYISETATLKGEEFLAKIVHTNDDLTVELLQQAVNLKGSQFLDQGKRVGKEETETGKLKRVSKWSLSQNENNQRAFTSDPERANEKLIADPVDHPHFRLTSYPFFNHSFVSDFPRLSPCSLTENVSLSSTLLESTTSQDTSSYLSNQYKSSLQKLFSQLNWQPTWFPSVRANYDPQSSVKGLFQCHSGQRQRDKMSPLQRCESTATLLWPLCVRVIISGESTSSLLLAVSDGWWFVKASLDAELQQLVQQRKIRDGSIVIVLTGNFQVPDSGDLILNLSYNGVRLSQSTKRKLGFVHPKYLTRGLSIKSLRLGDIVLIFELFYFLIDILFFRFWAGLCYSR
jgi:hypothetical protein